ncbi:MAG: DUF2231 domain-containing protein [Aquificae bacterium]|nr:DUF2231 domain-containing protein [Aquificota bacterium]
MEFLAEFHPPVVHFAIALTIAGVLFDTAGFILRKESLKHAGFWTFIFGVIAVWGAVITGHGAEELVEKFVKGTPGEELLEKHEEIGEVLPWVLTVLGLFRTYIFFKEKASLFIIYIIAGLIAIGVIGYQGRIGGKMVYEYGIGVKINKLQSSYHYEEYEHEED